MRDLSSKTIIITGGSLGIGLAVAKKCAEAGARIIVVSRNQSDQTNALDEIKNVSDQTHLSYSLDISSLDAVEKFAGWCLENKIEINGLVNCAGIYGPIGKTTEVDLEKFKEAININFLGTVYMCSRFAPHIKSNTKKKIINYSGGGAASPFPNYSAYATSKVAIVRFTENLSIELAPEAFDVNCIAPGFVITRLHQQTLDAGIDKVGSNFFENTRKQIDSGGVPPEKAAELTVFLLSEKSDGITGKFISAPWDPWDREDFRDSLRSDKNLATLRRIDNKNFCGKE